jgi:hypothetical protein
MLQILPQDRYGLIGQRQHERRMGLALLDLHGSAIPVDSIQTQRTDLAGPLAAMRHQAPNGVIAPAGSARTID